MVWQSHHRQIFQCRKKRTISDEILQQRGRKPSLQTLCAEPISRPAAAVDRHAARLHPVARRLRRRHADESARRGAQLLCCLSRAGRFGQHLQVLELVSSGRSNPRPGRAGADSWPHPPGHERLLGGRRTQSMPPGSRPVRRLPPSWRRPIPTSMRQSACIPASPAARPATFPRPSRQCVGVGRLRGAGQAANCPAEGDIRGSYRQLCSMVTKTRQCTQTTATTLLPS